MNSNFQIRGDANNPYHLSVGAVILENNQIILLKKANGNVTLPRETMYLKESIKKTLIRGAEEEIGIIVEVEKYLGSQITFFKRPDNTNVEKTTLYFLAKKLKETTKKQELDELEDEIITLDIKNGTDLLKKQGNEEYKILERLIGNKSFH